MLLNAHMNVIFVYYNRLMFDMIYWIWLSLSIQGSTECTPPQKKDESRKKSDDVQIDTSIQLTVEPRNEKNKEESSNSNLTTTKLSLASNGVPNNDSTNLNDGLPEVLCLSKTKTEKGGWYLSSTLHIITFLDIILVICEG